MDSLIKCLTIEQVNNHQEEWDWDTVQWIVMITTQPSLLEIPNLGLKKQPIHVSIQ